MVKEQSQQALALIQGDTIEHLLSQKQLAVWSWVQDRRSDFSRKDVIAALGFPARTVEQIIKKLVELNRLERLGEGKATRYRVIT